MNRIALIFALCLSMASLAHAAELRIRLAPPPGASSRITVVRAELLFGWRGEVKRVPLSVDVTNQGAIVHVPLDARSYQSTGAQTPPERASIYVVPGGYAQIRSDDFAWLSDQLPRAVVRFANVSTTITNGNTTEMTLPLRRESKKRLRFVDESARPLTDITVSVDAFWSLDNHCGFPAGAVRLLSNARPDGAGILAVPDGDIEYGVSIGSGHFSITDPRPLDGEPEYVVTRIPATERVVRIHRYVRTPLSIRVLVGDQPAQQISISATNTPPVCGARNGELGVTDAAGMLTFPDFYPEELAVCIGDQDGRAIWQLTNFDGNPVEVRFPTGTKLAPANFCN